MRTKIELKYFCDWPKIFLTYIWVTIKKLFSPTVHFHFPEKSCFHLKWVSKKYFYLQSGLQKKHLHSVSSSEVAGCHKDNAPKYVKINYKCIRYMAYALNRIWSRISTTEATFQCHIIDSTVFQTNSFDFLSEFA